MCFFEGHAAVLIYGFFSFTDIQGTDYWFTGSYSKEPSGRLFKLTLICVAYSVFFMMGN